MSNFIQLEGSIINLEQACSVELYEDGKLAIELANGKEFILQKPLSETVWNGFLRLTKKDNMLDKIGNLIGR